MHYLVWSYLVSEKFVQVVLYSIEVIHGISDSVAKILDKAVDKYSLYNVKDTLTTAGVLLFSTHSALHASRQLKLPLCFKLWKESCRIRHHRWSSSHSNCFKKEPFQGLYLISDTNFDKYFEQIAGQKQAWADISAL